MADQQTEDSRSQQQEVKYIGAPRVWPSHIEQRTVPQDQMESLVFPPPRVPKRGSSEKRRSPPPTMRSCGGLKRFHAPNSRRKAISANWLMLMSCSRPSVITGSTTWRYLSSHSSFTSIGFCSRILPRTSGAAKAPCCRSP